MATNSQKCKGYNLIELLVVLAIVGILVVVGIMSMGSRRKPAVRELTQQMTASFAEAQQLARSTGHPVILHVNGATSNALTIDFEYQAPNPANGIIQTIRGGGFSVASLGSNANYAVPGIKLTQATATGVDMTNLKALGLVTDWDTFFVDSKAVFQGVETQTLSFSSGGQISQDCYITVSDPSPGPSSPLGLVIATRRNGTRAFYFSGEPGASWRSL